MINFSTVLFSATNLSLKILFLAFILSCFPWAFLLPRKPEFLYGLAGLSSGSPFLDQLS